MSVAKMRYQKEEAVCCDLRYFRYPPPPRVLWAFEYEIDGLE